LTIAPQQDLTVLALADREVNGPRRARDEWDHGRLVALTGDSQRAAPALEAEILDVGGARLSDTKSVETEQHCERGMCAVALLGGEQEASPFASVHSVPLGPLHLGPANVLGRIGADTSINART
jgi:hypothetical protein